MVNTFHYVMDNQTAKSYVSEAKTKKNGLKVFYSSWHKITE